MPARLVVICAALVGVIGLAPVTSEAKGRGEQVAFRYSTPDSEEARFTVLLYSRGWKCSGIIISPRLILTNAHCTRNLAPSDVTVAFGIRGRETTRSVTDISEFEVYKKDGIDEKRFSVSGDLAILRLRGKIPETFKPIKSNSELIERGVASNIKQAGYGNIKTKKGYINDTRLHSRVLSIEQDVFLGRHFNVINNTSDSSRMPCSGDSGGPWWIYDAGGAPILYGVHGFGDKGCGSEAGGIRVHWFYDWILSNAAKLDPEFDWPVAMDSASHCMKVSRQSASVGTAKIVIANSCDNVIACDYVVIRSFDELKDGWSYGNLIVGALGQNRIDRDIKIQNLAKSFVTCKLVRFRADLYKKD